MNASDAYDLWEESQVAGLSDVLKQIKNSAKQHSLLSYTFNQVTITPEIQRALVRRKFTTVKLALTDNQTIPKIVIHWDPKMTEQ